MEIKFIGCFIVALFCLTLLLGRAYAQELAVASRQQTIFAALEQLETREEAMRQAMQEAQIRSLSKSLALETEKKKPALSLAPKRLSSPLHSYLTDDITFNDNIDGVDIERNRRKSTLIHTFTPGLKRNFIGKGKSLLLDMNLGNTFYNNRSRSNAQSAALDVLNVFKLGKYTWSFYDNYFNNYLAIRALEVDEDNVTNYWKNSFSVGVGRQFSRLGYNLKYSRADYKYESVSSDSDYSDETLSFNPYLRLGKKSRLLLEYSRQRIKYTDTSAPDDSGVNNLALTFSNALSAKITGLFKGSYKLSDNKVSDDSRQTSFNTGIGYSLSERSGMVFSFTHLVNEESTRASYYTENNLSLSGTHRLAFNPKLNLSFTTQAVYKDYPKKLTPPNPQKDATYTLKLGLSYAFRRWLDFSLDWTRTQFKSNVDDDYKRNGVVFKTQARF